MVAGPEVADPSDTETIKKEMRRMQLEMTRMMAKQREMVADFKV